MRRLVFLILFFYFFMVACHQPHSDASCLIVYTDSSSGKELLGYRSQTGEIVIPAKYYNGSDTLCKMAIVLTNDFKFIGIDRKDSTILIPYIYDNGPDYVEEGLFRFIENDKMGYANLDGEKVIAAKYDFATPFVEGIAAYFIGGEPIYEDGRTRQQIIIESGEESLYDLHWTWGGAILEQGYINRHGKEFIEITELENNKRLALTKDSIKIILNEMGEITSSRE